MQMNCKSCKSSFQVTDLDLNFYNKLDIPVPSLCPDCRNQLRLMFRNERKIYSRKCDATGKQIISIYSPELPYKVYDQEYWLSDKWDAAEYAMDLDLSKPFFDQMQELILKVPHTAVGYRDNSENCEYTTYQNNSKNCYLTFGCGWMEDCAYCNWTYYAKDCYDCLGTYNSELCYELIDCDKMYNCKYCQESSGLTDCSYCYECYSSQNCFGCVGLVRRQYCLFNKQLSKEEYDKQISAINQAESETKFNELMRKTPHRALHNLNCENSTGDHLINCKNIRDSFNDNDTQDSSFQHDIIGNKDCYDCNRTGLSEVSAEIIGGGWYYNCLAGLTCRTISDSFYNFFCWNSKNLFGCAALKNKQYCILNKQYSKEEYEKLVPQIIEMMKKTGEWGQFFPANLSPFTYNESLAQDFYPLTKEQVLAKGLRWKDPDKKEYMPANNDILACKQCGKNYKINPKEQQFYNKLGIGIPGLCPECRLNRKMDLRNSRKIHNTKCDNCRKEIITSYPSEAKFMIYCDECYLKEMHA